MTASTDNQADRPGDPPRPQASPRGGVGGQAPLALLVLVAAGTLLYSITHETQRAWNGSAEVAVTLEGRHYRVGPDEMRWLEGFSTLHFTEGEQAAREIAASEIDAYLERAFGHAREQVPAFADWYYSLGAEYARIGMAALSFAGLAEPDYVASRAASMLFPDDLWNEQLESLERRASARLRVHETRVRESWLGAVSQRLASHRVPAPIPGAAPGRDRVIVLDALLTDLVAREQAALTRRLSISTLAASGVAAGPALMRAAQARRAAGAGRVALRTTSRGAARVGSAALAGGALCSPGGPIAAGCALVAGAAVWLGADWLLLRVEEHFGRDELVAALESSLAEMQTGVETELLDAYDALVAADYEAMRDDVSRSFVPAQAGR